MALQGFSHIGICVTDLDRSRRFYCDVLGFSQLYALDFHDDEVAATMEQSGAFRSTMLRREDVRIELLQWVDVETVGDGRRKAMNELGFTHLSFRVDDVDELTGAVEAAGGTVHRHTRTVLGDGEDAPEFIYITDPDGTRIELMANVPDLSTTGSTDSSAFATPLTLTGPARRPRQLLAEQTFGGHASLHDETTAGGLGLSGAPIEAPTHFSQFDPLACALWGRRWFETGCISAHFSTMVVEGEEVTASLTSTGPGSGTIEASKPDGSVVLRGTASVDPTVQTALGERLGRLGDPGELFIVDQLELGMRSKATATASVDFESSNGELYPFSLRQKLDAITEPSDWYASDANPWGRPILPFEMISVLAQKSGTDFPVRGPAIGLFLDLEIRLIAGPLFVGQSYRIDREVVGLGQSRRTESYWVRSTLTDADTNDPAAVVLLHSGVFKESYAGYPADRL